MGVLLDSLTGVNDAVVKYLSANKHFLSLNGLASLTEPAAQYLGKSKADVSLDGVVELSDVAAAALDRKARGKKLSMRKVLLAWDKKMTTRQSRRQRPKNCPTTAVRFG